MTRAGSCVGLLLAAGLSCAMSARADAPVTFSTATDAYRSGDFDKSFTQLRQLAEMWDARAQLLLGLAMAGGSHVPKDSAQGLAWVLMAASGAGYGGSARDEAEDMRTKLWAKAGGPEQAAAKAAVDDLWRARDSIK